MLINIIRTLYHLPRWVVCQFQLVRLKAKGVYFGNGIQLVGRTRWYIMGRLVIGSNFVSASNQKHSIDTQVCSKVTVGKKGVLKIGNNVGITNTSIQCEDRIEIGDYVIIGAGVLIMDSNFHDTSWKNRRNADTGCNTAKTSPVIIGDDCFIGARSIICKGVKIGPRSTIAAGSVVVKDVPSDEVWGGNPAQFICKNAEFC